MGRESFSFTVSYFTVLVYRRRYHLTPPNTAGFLLVHSVCSNTASIRDEPYWTSRKNSLELIELSSINTVSLVLVWVSSSNTGSIRDDLYWTSRENSLELIELSSINIVSLVSVWVSCCSKTGSMRDDPYTGPLGRTV